MFIMRGFLFLILAVLSGEPEIQEKLDSSVVSAGRAGRSTPVAYTTLGRPELRSVPASSSLPMALDLQPSVVTLNQGGTGVGYSSMRVRGVTGSQTVVSLNGITLNDAESQEVFWVNIPSVGSYLGSVQLQRGLGTSSNGPGAFGASVDMDMALPVERSGEASVSAGSFRTFTFGARASSGLLPGGIYAEFAASLQNTQGYVRNGLADVASVYGTFGWRGENDILKATLLHGRQHSGITWEGMPQSRFEAGDYTYNPAGEYLTPDGTVAYYDNQSDNYRQTHLQLMYSHEFGEGLVWKTTLNRTSGSGYYEQLEEMLRRDALDNTLLVCRTELTLTRNRVKSTGGIYLSTYNGGHTGQEISPELQPLYSNSARKRELDAWIRCEWRATPFLTSYADLQYRGVNHTMDGPDEYGQVLDFEGNWRFFNPRAGVTLSIGRCSSLFASAAFGHKEPGRPDLQASTALKPERMLDIELGGSHSSGIWRGSANIYCMEYFDMLLETGRINAAGYTVRENTPRAWRRGIELAASASPGIFRFEGNVSLSTNRVKEYTAYIDTYSHDWTFLGQTKERYDGTDILLSPSVVGMVSVAASVWKGCTVRTSGKLVGSQFWDNTSNPDRRIPAYYVQNLSLSQTLEFHGEWVLDIAAENLFSNRYYADAWVWRALVGGVEYRSEGLFAQAPFNVQARVSYRF